MLRSVRLLAVFKTGRLHGKQLSGNVVRSPFPDIDLTATNQPLPQFIMKDFLREDRRSLVAIVDGTNDTSVTFKQLHDHTYSFAHSLRQLGIQKGDCVLIVSPNHLHFFTAFFGIGLVGAVSSCVNPLYTEYEIEAQIVATGAKLVIAHSSCLTKVLKISKNLPVMLLDDDESVDSNINNKPEHVLKLSQFVRNSLTSFDVSSFLPPAGFDGNDTVTIPFSSGTTGGPKGVMLTHRSIIANILQMYPFEGCLLESTHKNSISVSSSVSVSINNCNASASGSSSGDVGTTSRSTGGDHSGDVSAACGGRQVVLVNPMPYFHIYGLVIGLMSPARAGARQVMLPSPFDLRLFLHAIQKYRASRAYIVPPIALLLAKHPLVDQYDLSSLRTLLCGAAPLGIDIQRQCSERLSCRVQQSWGMTELSPIGTFFPERLPEYRNRDRERLPEGDRDKEREWGREEKEDRERLLSLGACSGYLMPNSEARLVDPVSGAELVLNNVNDDATAATAEGLLQIRGPQVMRGYLNNPQATDEMICRREGWVTTGDIGRFDGEGRLYITDRLKELIKYKGYQVAPAELEAVIASMPLVRDCIVIPVDCPEQGGGGGEVARAYVVREPQQQQLTEREVCEYVAARLAPYKWLRGGVRFIEEVPKSPSGKLLRRVMRDLDRQTTSAAVAASGASGAVVVEEERLSQ